MSGSIQFPDLLGKRWYRFLFVFAVGCSVVLYGWIVFYGYFFSDDFTWLWHGMKVNNSVSNILSFRMSTFYSPMLNAFYSLAFRWWGWQTEPYYLFSLSLHVLVTFFFSVFTYQLTRSRYASVFSLILAVIVGSAYEPLVWIGANMHSMVTLFIIISVICYQAFLIRRTHRYLLSSVILFFFFFFS